MENPEQTIGETTEKFNSSLEGFDTGEHLVKISEERLETLKGLYRTQLGFEQGAGEEMPHVVE